MKRVKVIRTGLKKDGMKTSNPSTSFPKKEEKLKPVISNTALVDSSFYNPNSNKNNGSNNLNKGIIFGILITVSIVIIFLIGFFVNSLVQ